MSVKPCISQIKTALREVSSDELPYDEFDSSAFSKNRKAYLLNNSLTYLYIGESVRLIVQDHNISS